MTGYSRNAIVHQGRLDSGVQMLQKPVTSIELARKIREVLDAANAHGATGHRRSFGREAAQTARTFARWIAVHTAYGVAGIGISRTP